MTRDTKSMTRSAQGWTSETEINGLEPSHWVRNMLDVSMVDLGNCVTPSYQSALFSLHRFGYFKSASLLSGV